MNVLKDRIVAGLTQKLIDVLPSSGVPLAHSDILKVLLVSARPNARTVFGLLRGYNSCKQALLKASNHLNKQRGTSFWGKVLSSKVIVVNGHSSSCLWEHAK